MATSYKIRLKRFNGTDYDTLNLISDNIIMSSGNNLQTDYNNLDGAIDDIVYVGDNAPTDPNTKIWLDTDASGASAVNSINGKAGTVVLDADDVGAMSEWELLWTNASPDSSFGSQTISLDMSGYDFVLIQFYDFNSQDSSRARLNTIAEMNSRTALLYGWYSNRVGHRLATVNSTGIQFGNCNYNNTLFNDSAVPLRIFGIKGVVTT